MLGHICHMRYQILIVTCIASFRVHTSNESDKANENCKIHSSNSANHLCFDFGCLLKQLCEL
jgi:hypothetical protein